jgi:hypothetical protein
MAQRAPYRGPTGTGFVSLKRYLELNPEAAQRMGGALTSGVEQRGAAAQARLGQAAGDFASKAEEGTTTYGQAGTAEEAQSRGEGAVYSGPRQLSEVVGDYAGLQRDVDDATMRAGLLGSDAGRAVLLRERYGQNAGYTPGAAGLDAFLAGRGGGQAMEAAGSKWGKLRESLGLAEKTALAQAQGAMDVTADARKRFLADAERLRGQEAAAAQQRALNAAKANAPRTAPNYSSPDSQVTPGKKGGGTTGGVIGRNEYGEREYQDAPEFRPRMRYP